MIMPKKKFGFGSGILVSSEIFQIMAQAYPSGLYVHGLDKGQMKSSFFMASLDLHGMGTQGQERTRHIQGLDIDADPRYLLHIHVATACRMPSHCKNQQDHHRST